MPEVEYTIGDLSLSRTIDPGHGPNDPICFELGTLPLTHRTSDEKFDVFQWARDHHGDLSQYLNASQVPVQISDNRLFLGQGNVRVPGTLPIRAGRTSYWHNDGSKCEQNAMFALFTVSAPLKRGPTFWIHEDPLIVALQTYWKTSLSKELVRKILEGGALNPLVQSQTEVALAQVQVGRTLWAELSKPTVVFFNGTTHFHRGDASTEGEYLTKWIYNPNRLA